MTTVSVQQADFFQDGAPPPSVPRGLTGWEPSRWAGAPDWQPTLARFWASVPAQRLAQFVTGRLAAGAIVYPPQPLRALELTSLDKVRVVILGQDPYHGPGQAEGLAFSVASGTKLPPSLRNIFKELARDPALRGADAAPPALPSDGSLVRWARQGVLLLNTCLTVEDAQPASHANQGWEVLTDEVIKAVLNNGEPVVFMLWGAHAQHMAEVVRRCGEAVNAPEEAGRHLILCANHPSPLSALRPPRPFIGCGHFSQANAFLQRQGCRPIAW